MFSARPAIQQFIIQAFDSRIDFIGSQCNVVCTSWIWITIIYSLKNKISRKIEKFREIYRRTLLQEQFIRLRLNQVLIGLILDFVIFCCERCFPSRDFFSLLVISFRKAIWDKGIEESIYIRDN